MSDLVRIDRCRCCLGGRLASVLDLGEMPLANGLHTGTPGPRFPLELMVCEDCWHGQLSVVVPGDVLFTDYPYRSGVSRAFRGHCEQLAAAALNMVSPLHPAVLDIGCNDGVLLSLFREAGCDVLGVDPARDLGLHPFMADVPIVRGFWTAALAASLERQFDIITAQNVFAHVPDPGGFLAGCAACLAPGGVVLIEVPWFLELIGRNEFDTVYHEHLSYFTAGSLVCLAERSPLVIADIERVPVHGGSLRVTLRKRPGARGPAVNDFLQTERVGGMRDAATYRAFRERVARNRRELQELVAEARLKGEKVVGYGASAKGAVAINYCGLHLDYVVDDTPGKQGKFMPGNPTPVVGPLVLAQEARPVNIVVLAWNWFDEVRERIRSLRGSERDRLIRYVPEVSWVPWRDRHVSEEA